MSHNCLAPWSRLALGIAFLILGVVTQIILSLVMAKYSTIGTMSTCDSCGSVRISGDGRVVTRGSLDRLHWFRVTTSREVDPGDPSCRHEWRRKTVLAGVSLLPMAYPITLVLSIVFLVTSLASIVSSLLLRFCQRCSGQHSGEHSGYVNRIDAPPDQPTGSGDTTPN
jgi:hypothetical protein